jgi:hypothetical protein
LKARGFLDGSVKMGKASMLMGKLVVFANSGIKRFGGSRIATGRRFFESANSSTRTQLEDRGRISRESH